MFVCQSIRSCVGRHFKKWWRLDSICEAIVLFTRFFLLRTDLFPVSMIVFCFYFKKGTLDRRYTINIINIYISCIRDIKCETKDRRGHTGPLPVHIGCRLPEHNQQNLYMSRTNHAISVVQDVAMNGMLFDWRGPSTTLTHGSDPPKQALPMLLGPLRCRWGEDCQPVATGQLEIDFGWKNPQKTGTIPKLS